MPDGITYTDEKYIDAINLMATAGGSLRERLERAYAGSAMRAHDPGTSVSAELGERIRSFHLRMTGVLTIGDEGRIAATVEAMDDDQVREAAEELFGIALALRNECWEFLNRRRLNPEN